MDRSNLPMSRILAEARATPRSVKRLTTEGLSWCVGTAMVFGVGAWLVHRAGRPDIAKRLLVMIGIAAVASVFHIPSLVRMMKGRAGTLRDGP